MVPSAKVEFYLVNPSLGFDTRYATKLGVAAGRVQAHGASEVSLDYRVPPTLSGHRCLFARVFSFSPLDLPIDDFALDPRIDRHIGQLNLNIVGTGHELHPRLDPPSERRRAARARADDRCDATRDSARDGDRARLRDGARWKELGDRVTFEVAPGEAAGIEIKRLADGLELVSTNADAVSLERQAELTKEVQSALRTLEQGRGDATKYRELFREYRAMTAQSVRTQVSIGLPELGLKPGQAVALNVIRRSVATGEALGGIGLVIAGQQA